MDEPQRDAKIAPPPPRKNIIYVGYQINDSDLVAKLLPILGEKAKLVNPHAMVTHLYYTENTTQFLMESWYNKNTEVSIGRLKRYFLHEIVSKKNHFITIVGDFTIGAGHYYVTLYDNNVNIKAFSLRLMALNGRLGKPIDVEADVQINFGKCIHREEPQHWQKRNIQRF